MHLTSWPWWFSKILFLWLLWHLHPLFISCLPSLSFLVDFADSSFSTWLLHFSFSSSGLCSDHIQGDLMHFQISDTIYIQIVSKFLFLTGAPSRSPDPSIQISTSCWHKCLAVTLRQCVYNWVHYLFPKMSFSSNNLCLSKRNHHLLLFKSEKWMSSLIPSPLP